MAQKDLTDLFHDGLGYTYYAERKILENLRKLARGAQSEELKAGFLAHAEETEGQIERLQQLFELLDKSARGKTCPAIDGIIVEAEDVLEEYKDTAALDAGLVAAAQAVEHYEIWRYGTLKRWANVLGMPEAVDLIEQSEQEEIRTDGLLTEIADLIANEEAAQVPPEQT